MTYTPVDKPQQTPIREVKPHEVVPAQPEPATFTTDVVRRGLSWHEGVAQTKPQAGLA